MISVTSSPASASLTPSIPPIAPHDDTDSHDKPLPAPEFRLRTTRTRSARGRSIRRRPRSRGRAVSSDSKTKRPRKEASQSRGGSTPSIVAPPAEKQPPRLTRALEPWPAVAPPTKEWKLRMLQVLNELQHVSSKRKLLTSAHSVLIMSPATSAAPRGVMLAGLRPRLGCVPKAAARGALVILSSSGSSGLDCTTAWTSTLALIGRLCALLHRLIKT